MGRLLKRKEETHFFDLFVEAAGYSKEAACCFRDAWKDQKLDQDRLQKVKEIEHKGDLLVHRSLQAVESAFITPIDRADLLSLTNCIENVTDSIDELSNHCYLMNLQQGNRYIETFTGLLCEATEAVCELMQAFSAYKKSREEVDALVRKINQIEEQGDANYVLALRELYRDPPSSAVDMMRYQKIYELMEQCIDRTEDVADSVSSIIISAS